MFPVLYPFSEIKKLVFFLCKLSNPVIDLGQKTVSPSAIRVFLDKFNKLLMRGLKIVIIKLALID